MSDVEFDLVKEWTAVVDRLADAAKDKTPIIFNVQECQALWAGLTRLNTAYAAQHKRRL